MFLPFARFHAQRLCFKALILAFTTWHFQRTGSNTRQRGEISHSGWRPWLKNVCDIQNIVCIFLIEIKNVKIVANWRKVSKTWYDNTILYLCVSLDSVRNRKTSPINLSQSRTRASQPRARKGLGTGLFCPLPSPMKKTTQLEINIYSGTPLYGHPLITDGHPLITDSFSCPEKKLIYFL